MLSEKGLSRDLKTVIEHKENLSRLNSIKQNLSRISSSVDANKSAPYSSERLEAASLKIDLEEVSPEVNIGTEIDYSHSSKVDWVEKLRFGINFEEVNLDFLTSKVIVIMPVFVVLTVMSFGLIHLVLNALQSRVM